jgi:hypothetical protein
MRATSNVRGTVIVLAALGAVALSPTILWAMPQPGTCTGYYPISPQYWLACDTSKYFKRIALGCSVAKWGAEVKASYGVAWSHWSGASSKQIQYKADGAKWFAKVRAKPCFWP